jgi:rhamnosyltransferase
VFFPFSTVIICSRNGGKYIYEQLKSIQNQTIAINCIKVFDFNSSDNTVDEVQRFSSELISNQSSILFRLYRFSDANGVNSSFYTALMSLGPIIKPDELFYFCDQDDVWLPKKHESILQEIKHYNLFTELLLLHHDVVVVDANLNLIRSSYYDKSQRLLLQYERPSCLYFGTCIGHTMCISGNAVQLLRHSRFNEDVFMYDWFWSSLIEQLGKRHFIPIALSKYRQHGQNLIGAFSAKRNFLQQLVNFFKIKYLLARQINLVILQKRATFAQRNVDASDRRGESEFTIFISSLKMAFLTRNLKLIFSIFTIGIILVFNKKSTNFL